MILKFFLTMLTAMNVTMWAASINLELLPREQRKASNRCAMFCENLQSYCTLENGLKAGGGAVIFSAALCDAFASVPEIQTILTVAVLSKVASGLILVPLNVSEKEWLRKIVAGAYGISWGIANISTWVAVHRIPSTPLQISACLTFFSPAPVVGLIWRTLPEGLTSRCGNLFRGNWCARDSG